MSICNYLEKNVIGNDSQWFWAMVQAIGVIVTLWLIGRQLKLQRLANTLTSLTAVSSRWNEKDMMTARREICRAYLDGKIESTQSTLAVAGFLEEIGVYVKMEVVDVKIVWELYGDYVEHYWPILLQRIRDAQTMDAAGYENFSALHKQCVKISAKSDPKTAERSQEDLKDFALSELDHPAK